MEKKFKRRRILINKPVQFVFSGITIYFILIVIIVVGGLTYFITLNTILSQLEIENKFINAYEIVKNINILLLKRTGFHILLLIILVFYLEVRFLHRIAGPLYRIEKTLKEISEGKDVEPIKLRKKDFYKTLADEVNKVIEYINKLKKG
jgi:methyl-accepting chemotaxis protein